MIVCVVVIALIVGFLVGCTGIGGIILIPAVAYCLNMSSHLAMGTALFTFIFVTILSSFLYIRLGAVDWKLTLPLCIGALPFSYLGALAKASASASLLNLLLGCLILLAGAVVFYPIKGQNWAFMCEDSPWRLRSFLFVGGSVAFVSGMTGAGGPVLSTPILIALGVSPISAVASGQVYSLIVGISGSIANFQEGAIDWVAGGWLALAQMVGVLFGVWLVRYMDTSRLRNYVGGLCLLTGAFILFNLIRSV